MDKDKYERGNIKGPDIFNITETTIEYATNPILHVRSDIVELTNSYQINYKDCWNDLKKSLINYKMEKSGQDHYVRDTIGRYCIAMQIDEILDKMEDIEENNKKRW